MAKSELVAMFSQVKNLMSWVEVGDYVEQDEEIATIETDKVSRVVEV